LRLACLLQAGHMAEPSNQLLESGGVAGIKVNKLKFFNLHPAVWAVDAMFLYHQTCLRATHRQVGLKLKD